MTVGKQGNYVIKQRDNKDSAKQTCAELVSLRLSACSSSHISTFLSRCDFPALKKVDICLPNTNEGAARPYKLDFISALPKSLTHFALMEDSEVYNTTSIEWPDVAKDLPQLQHLSTNLSTSAFCMTSSPFPKLSDLKLIYPHPSPLAFFRCLKDNAWMPDLKHLALENWSGSPCVEHLTVEGVGYIKEKGDVPGMLILHQYDMLDQQVRLHDC